MNNLKGVDFLLSMGLIAFVLSFISGQIRGLLGLTIMITSGVLGFMGKEKQKSWTERLSLGGIVIGFIIFLLL